MSLVTVQEVRDLVQTGLNDVRLQAVLDREEAALVLRCGAHYVDSSTRITTTLPGGMLNLYLPRRLTSVYRVTEDGTVLTAETDFRIWHEEGRLERLPAGTKWGSVVAVLYVPYNDNEHRKAVLIELVRLALERTAMHSENIAGEYSFTAPEWELERARLYRQLTFQVV